MKILVRHVDMLMLYVSVVGEKEVANQTANVRTRDNKVHGEHSIDAILQRFQQFKDSKTQNTEDEF
jgi:threonyl-tRNA synthetase